jgi:hypothetical protein
MPKYLVEAISSFRIRYVIDTENPEYAQDTVVMEEAEEFGQKHLGEQIIGCREVTDEEIPILFFEDHPYLERLGPEKAMKYVHVVTKEKEN